MGYVLRARMASFFSGAASASFIGFYVLCKDYKVKGLRESLDQRISALEKLKQTEVLQPAEGTE